MQPAVRKWHPKPPGHWVLKRSLILKKVKGTSGHGRRAHSGPSTEWREVWERRGCALLQGGALQQRWGQSLTGGHRRRAVCAEPTLQEFNLFNIVPGKEENK